MRVECEKGDDCGKCGEGAGDFVFSDCGEIRTLCRRKGKKIKEVNNDVDKQMD